MRLDRWLTALALGSRSQTGAMVRAGRVSVNGITAKDPGMACDPDGDVLRADGEIIDARLTRHVMLNKPAGVLTAARDKKQPTVQDLLPEVYKSLGCMPVGRLDKDTTGLLLFTTDGELSHRLLAPQRHVDKVYLAEVDGRLDENDVKRFAAGIVLKDFTAAPALLEIMDAGERSVARITVHEGRFHQVRRMCAAVGHEVLALRREAFGPLRLGPELPEGAWRELTETETAALYNAAGMEKL